MKANAPPGVVPPVATTDGVHFDRDPAAGRAAGAPGLPAEALTARPATARGVHGRPVPAGQLRTTVSGCSLPRTSETMARNRVPSADTAKSLHVGRAGRDKDGHRRSQLERRRRTDGEGHHVAFVGEIEAARPRRGSSVATGPRPSGRASLDAAPERVRRRPPVAPTRRTGTRRRGRRGRTAAHARRRRIRAALKEPRAWTVGGSAGRRLHEGSSGGIRASSRRAKRPPPPVGARRGGARPPLPSRGPCGRDAQDHRESPGRPRRGRQAARRRCLRCPGPTSAASRRRGRDRWSRGPTCRFPASSGRTARVPPSGDRRTFR